MMLGTIGPSFFLIEKSDIWSFDSIFIYGCLLSQADTPLRGMDKLSGELTQNCFCCPAEGAFHSFFFHFYLCMAVTQKKCKQTKYNSTCPLNTVSIHCKHTK